MQLRILCDENISWRLKKLIPVWDILPVNEIETNQKLSDKVIWQFAKSNGYCILTFDEDFFEIQNLMGFPPKIIWLRHGNVPTQIIADTLLAHEDAITVFLADEKSGVLELYL